MLIAIPFISLASVSIEGRNHLSALALEIFSGIRERPREFVSFRRTARG